MLQHLSGLFNSTPARKNRDNDNRPVPSTRSLADVDRFDIPMKTAYPTKSAPDTSSSESRTDISRARSSPATSSNKRRLNLGDESRDAHVQSKRFRSAHVETDEDVSRNNTLFDVPGESPATLPALTENTSESSSDFDDVGSPKGWNEVDAVDATTFDIGIDEAPEFDWDDLLLGRTDKLKFIWTPSPASAGGESVEPGKPSTTFDFDDTPSPEPYPKPEEEPFCGNYTYSTTRQEGHGPERETVLGTIEREGQDSSSDQADDDEDVPAPPTLSLIPVNLVNPNQIGRRALRSPSTPETPSMFLKSQTLLSHGWPEDTLELLQHLHHRGREPILPAHWSMDFPSLPAALFSAALPTLPTPASAEEEEEEEEEGEEAAFIHSLGFNNKTDFHGTKALAALFQIPSRARDLVKTGLGPEKGIEKGISQYLSWAYQDSGLEVPSTRPSLAPEDEEVPEMPALVVTHTAPHTLDSCTLEATVQNRLVGLRREWADYFALLAAYHAETPEAGVEPTVFAVVISHTVVAVVAYAGEGLRQVGYLDLGVADGDVWNGLALAILAMHARYVSSAIWDEYVDGGDSDDEDEEEEEEEWRLQGAEDPDL